MTKKIRIDISKENGFSMFFIVDEKMAEEIQRFKCPVRVSKYLTDNYAEVKEVEFIEDGELDIIMDYTERTKEIVEDKSLSLAPSIFLKQTEHLGKY